MNWSSMVCSVLLTGLISMGIGCKDHPKQKKTVVAAKKQVADKPTPPEPAPAQKKEPTLPASVEGVSDLSLAVVKVEALLAARRQNTRGFRFYKKKKYAKAAAAFTKALAEAPGHLLARYNLACTLALQGEGGKALVLLSQLKRAGCVLCLKQLVHAVKDKDFDGLRKDVRFKKLISDVEVKEPDYKKVAGRVLRAIVRGNSSPGIETIKAGRAILYRSIWEDMSDGADPPEPSYRLISTVADAETLGSPIMANEVEYPYQAGEIADCKGTCCWVNAPGGMNVQDITKVCFWPVSAEKAVLVSMDVMLCGA